MLDTSTKKRIDDCRDILVGKLPDPKAQIEQITIGLIYKFMDDMDKEAVELGGTAKFFTDYTLPDPDDPTKTKTVEFAKYGWDNLFDTRVTATEMLNLYAEAIQGMDKNPNIPGLFRDIFKNAFLPYRDPETLKLFLKTIGEFEYTHSEKLGDAFEYLLSVMGSQGDAGQFRTPRHIIDFLVAIVDPGKNDTILDPACGTAGFLISAYKYITDTKKGALTPDERKKLIRNFAGYDISPDMVRLSLVNLYLHGFPDPHIVEYDTLSSEDRWNESYDVILANPPFMSPKGGIRPHKKFTISSNRSEVLFVDYIAEHLNPNGRAGIIVPEGVIFQSGTAYKELRKMLVDGYLYAVVSLPAGVFNPYSGVKTSILLMDKTLARQRDEVLFVKIDNDGYNLGAQRNAVKGGQLDEAIALIHAFARTGTCPESTLAHAVPKTEIAKNGDYNLSGERYRIEKVGATKFPLITLAEIVDVKGGKRLPMGATYSDVKTAHAYIRVADFENTFLNTSDLKYISKEVHSQISNYVINKEDVYISIAGTIGTVGIIPKELDGANLTENAAKLVIREKNTTYYKFLELVLRDNKARIQINTFTHAVGVPKLALTRIKQIQIPLPPLATQEEIVAEIEGYQKIIDGAKAVLDHYKPKIEIDPDWEMVEFENAPFQIIDGDRGVNYPSSEDFSPDGYCLFLNTKNVRPDGFNFKECMFISKEKDELLRKGKLKRGDVLLTTRGTIGNTAYYSDSILFDNIRINSGMLIFRPEPSLLYSKYLYYFFQSQNCESQFGRIISGAAQPQLPIRSLKSALIPLPKIEIQRQIVTQIEKEQALVNANKELVEIFEQKIKDRIAKVWGTSATLSTGTSTGAEAREREFAEATLPMAAEEERQYGLFE